MDFNEIVSIPSEEKKNIQHLCIPHIPGKTMKKKKKKAKKQFKQQIASTINRTTHRYDVMFEVFLFILCISFFFLFFCSWNGKYAKTNTWRIVIKIASYALQMGFVLILPSRYHYIWIFFFFLQRSWRKEEFFFS